MNIYMKFIISVILNDIFLCLESGIFLDVLINLFFHLAGYVHLPQVATGLISCHNILSFFRYKVNLFFLVAKMKSFVDVLCNQKYI